LNIEFSKSTKSQPLSRNSSPRKRSRSRSASSSPVLKRRRTDNSRSPSRSRSRSRSPSRSPSRSRTRSRSPSRSPRRIRRTRSPSPSPPRTALQQTLAERSVLISDLLFGTTADQLEKLLSSCLNQSLSESTSQIESVVVDEENNSAVVRFKTISAAHQCLTLGQVVSFGRILQIRSLSGKDQPPVKETEQRVQSNVSFSSFNEMMNFFSSKRSLLGHLDSAHFKQVNILLSVNVLGAESQIKQSQRNLTEAFGNNQFVHE